MSSADEYTGDCWVGGPPARRDLPGLRVTKIAVGTQENNVYLLRCSATGDTLIIDAPAPHQAIVSALGDGDGDGTPTAIAITHGHHDHVAGLKALAALLGVPVLSHLADASLLPVPVTRTVADGDIVTVGAARLRAIHLRGHTPGGLALLYDADGSRSDSPHVFVGDSLFPGGPGATFGDPAAFTQLMADLEEKLFDRLPDETWIYPGHGRDTTLGAERPHLGEWRARGW